jgi:hypothetical protein
MKRFFSTMVLAGLFLVSWSPQLALAHGGRWGCGYSSGYTYYYPRYYYPTYNSCSSYYGNYGSYYGGSYVPYPSYGYNVPYNNFGLGLGGGNILGLLAGSGLMGANLSGSLMQPSYLSMPVSVGYGQSGFLQIPMGNSSGRGTYLQIPVNTGYGPSSYLQIELGRNTGSGVPSAPTPSATPNVPPFGAVPGVNTATGGQFTYDTPKTPADEVPPVVAPLESVPETAMAASTKTTPVRHLSSSRGQSDTDAATTKSDIQFVSWSSTPTGRKNSLAQSDTPHAKDTSFSLVDSKPEDETGRTLKSESALAASMPGSEGTPWVVK